MDAITLLKNDHRSVEQLFRRYEQAGERAYVEKRGIVDRIIEELSAHAAVEEQLFYPVARASVPDTDDLALESLEEHHIVKWTLAELERMDATDERFDAKVTVLIEHVRHHVREEEQDFFPKVREELGRRSLGEMGDSMVEAKKLAPTHPHPTAPATPPGNLVVGVLAGLTDRVGDTLHGLAQGGVSAVGDLVARVRRTPSRQPAPTGSSIARARAVQVRSAAASATDAVIDVVRTTSDAADEVVDTTREAAAVAEQGATRTARRAATGARATARTAKAGAKGTATSARKAASSTSTTAKRASTSTRRTAAKAATTTGRSATRTAKDTAAKVRSAS